MLRQSPSNLLRPLGLIFPSAFAILTIGLLVSVFLWSQFQKSKDAYLSGRLDAWTGAMKSLWNYQGAMASLARRQLESSEPIHSHLFLARDLDERSQNRARAALFRELLPLYRKFQESGFQFLQIYTPENEVFLRMHQPQSFGNPGAGTNPMVEWVNSNLEPMDGYLGGASSISGRRFVFPISADGVHLATAELTADPKALTRYLADLLGGPHEFAVRVSFDGYSDLARMDGTFRPSAFLPGFYVHEDGSEISGEFFRGLPSEARVSAVIAAADLFASMSESKVPSVETFRFGKLYWDASFFPFVDPTGRTVAVAFSVRPNEYLAGLLVGLYRDLAGAWATVILLVGLFSLSYWHRQDLTGRQKDLLDRFHQLDSLLPGAIFTLETGPAVGAAVFPDPSDGLAEAFGVDKSAMAASADAVFNSIHELDRQQVRRSLILASRKLQIWHADFRVKKLDGIRWFEVLAIPASNRDGSVTWTGLFLDVSDRKTLEVALRSEEQRFRDMAEAAGEYLWEVDPEGKFVFITEEAVRVYGRPINSLVNRSPLEFVTENTMAKARRCFVGKGKEPTPFRDEEICTLRPDGSEVWQKVSGRPYHDDSGKWMGYRGTAIDITVEHEAKTLVQETRERLDLATRAARIGIWDVDLLTGEMVWDDRMHAIYGVPKDGFGGSRSEWWKMLLPEDADRVKAEFRRFLQGYPEYRPEYRILTPSGEIRHIQSAAALLRNETGEPVRVVGINMDITDRKNAEEALNKSDTVLRTFVEHAPAAVAMFDREIRYIAHSQRWIQDYGVSGNTILGVSHFQVFPNLESKWSDLFNRCLNGEILSCSEERFAREDGQAQWLAWEIRPWFDSLGRVGGVIMMTSDVTERKMREQDLREAHEQLRAAQVLAKLGSWSWDAETDSVFWSEELYHIFHLDPRAEPAHFSSHPELFTEASWKIFRQAELLCRELGEPFDLELHCLRIDAKPVTVRIQGRVEFSPSGKVARLYGSAQDITESYLARLELERANQQLEEAIRRTEDLAAQDPLTGLQNRHSLRKALAEILPVCGVDYPAYLLYIDLDNFKTVNDTQGHGAGDEVLIEVADILRNAFASNELICRFGGDEFLGISRRDEHKTIELAELVIDRIRNHLFRDGERLYAIGASIGICVLERGVDREELISRADAACYSAKRKGRNQYEIYRPERDSVRELWMSSNWNRRIDEAIFEERFEIWFQPIVHMDTKEAFSYEALLRMREKDGTLIGPVHFIPAAERFHLMPELDLYVMRRVAGLLAKKHNLTINLNLSAQMLAREDFLQIVAAHFPSSKINPSRVIWEVTETEALANLEEAGIQTAGLRKLGFRVALDDFGSGFSSFDYLRKLEVDYLKIDGQIIKDLLDTKANLAFTKAINDIAQSMDLECIAEFVDREALADKLCEIGVRYGQGYLFAKPSPTIPDPADWGSASVWP